MATGIDSLDNVLRSLVNSVLKAQQVTAQQHLRELQRYFKEGRPVTTSIQVPNPSALTDEPQALEIPILALVPPSSIKINNLELDFKVRFLGLEGEKEGRKPFRAVAGDPETHSGQIRVEVATTEVADDVSVANVHVTFENADPPEAFNRIVGYLTVTTIP